MTIKPGDIFKQDNLYAGEMYVVMALRENGSDWLCIVLDSKAFGKPDPNFPVGSIKEHGSWWLLKDCTKVKNWKRDR